MASIHVNSHPSFRPRHLLQLVLLGFVMVTVPAATGSRGDAQTSLPTTSPNVARWPQADPADLGIRLGSNLRLAQEDERYLVPDQEGEPVVAKLYLRSGPHGERLAVLLPTGRLIAVDAREVTRTDRPFKPLPRKELAAQVLEKFPGFRQKTTRNYIFIYNTSEKFRDATVSILENMHSKIINYWDGLVDVEEPPFPLVVVMFRTEEEFDRYREMPEGVVAYYNSLSNYVVMYEQSRLAEVAPMIAVKQAISTVAHEGVHQLLHNIGVQRRLSSWPAWISEGLAEYFAPTSVGPRSRWKGIGQVNDLRLHRLDKLIQSRGQELDRGVLLQNTVRATSLDSDGYAAAWALTFHLAERQRKSFASYLQAVSQIEPTDAPPADAYESLFQEHFGQEYARLQAEMIGHLRTVNYLDPIEHQPHFVAAIRVRDRTTAFTTTSPAELQRWLQAEARKLNPAERAVAQQRVLIVGSRTEATRTANQLLQSR